MIIIGLPLKENAASWFVRLRNMKKVVGFFRKLQWLIITAQSSQPLFDCHSVCDSLKYACEQHNVWVMVCLLN